MKQRFDSYCPKCGKEFGKGDTIVLSKERVECCNICEPLQPLQLIRKTLQNNCWQGG